MKSQFNSLANTLLSENPDSDNIRIMAETFYKIISSEPFYQWYNRSFEDHVQEGNPDYNVIHSKIKEFITRYLR